MNKPLVSIIIRTCGRPKVLARALDSIRLQQYPNIEVVVVEDGNNISEEYIKNQYADLKLLYICLGVNKGRCIAANVGLKNSNGKYINFLDDDDILMPQHISLLVKTLEESNYCVAYSVAEEHQTKTTNSTEQEWRVKRKLIRYKQPFNRLLLCYMNYIPIQSVMFERSLYERYGGLDENLDVLEDWDLWLRYAIETDFIFVNEVTSIYYTPYKGIKKRKREIHMYKSEKEVVQKHAQYQLKISAEQVNRDMDYIVNVFNKKGIVFYMQKIRNYLLYRDR